MSVSVETKHTPGPWKAEPPDMNGAWWIVMDWPGFPFSIAEVRRGDEEAISEETNIANARLVAAAPDLLAACKEALDMVDEAYEATGFIKIAKTSKQRLRLEAAIAKATTL